MGDPVTTGIIISTALSAAGTVAVSQMNKPKAPAKPKLPEGALVKAPDTARLDTQHTKRLAAAGQQSLLTGPQGLGSDASVQRKSLLGM